MTKRLVYFDFDRTMIDTDLLKKEQEARISKITEIPREKLAQAMEKYVKEINHFDFTPEGYAFFLEKEFHINPSDVLKVYVTDLNYIVDFVFPEVPQVLQKLKELGHKMGIFSAAVPGHQLLKIERTGLLEFIDPDSIIIHPRKLAIEALEKLPDNVTVVDDDITIINNLARHVPRFHPIWCNRKTLETSEKVPTIHSFSDLLANNILN